MDPNRDAPEEPDPEGGPPLPLGSDPDPAAAQQASTGENNSRSTASSASVPSGSSPAAAPREYSYGSASKDPSGTASASDDGTEPEATPDDISDADPATGLHPATAAQSGAGLRHATAPRAVLRPVPEGFPTPPPRPARPNRRPAPKSEQEPAPQRRGRMIATLALVAALILTVGIGASILVYRTLAADAPAASDPVPTDTGSDGAPAADGDLAIGEVSVREVGTEVGVRQVGDAKQTVEPEGEFVIVTIEVVNGSDASVTLSKNVSLETADGSVVEVDSEATREHIAKSQDFGMVKAGESITVHAVYDVPVGSEPTALHLDLTANRDAGEGTLPLGG